MFDHAGKAYTGANTLAYFISLSVTNVYEIDHSLTRKCKPCVKKLLRENSQTYFFAAALANKKKKFYKIATK
jgi:hypothetical protein